MTRCGEDAGPRQGMFTEFSIVVPAYNEAARLPHSLAAIAHHLSGNQAWQPAEILVVDDGSRDGTGEVARAEMLPAGISLRVLTHERNQGKGAAVRTGFAASTGRWVLLCDADEATPIDELQTLVAAGDQNSVVIGSRAVDRSLIETRQPRHRDLMGRVFNLLVQALAAPGLRDTQCGFKLFPGELARALAGAQRLDGYAYDVELLLLARRWRFVVREVGVRWRHVEASRVQPVRHSGEMFRDLVVLFLRRTFGRLPVRPAGLSHHGP